MINFTRLVGPYGIPIYHQQLPDIVQSVSIDWVIFTGAADDYVAGTDGAYHWFEHVPFRGTQRFPGGYSATKGPFTRFGGSSGAWTNFECTCYWAHVLKEQFGQALNVTTDLWSQPLLTDDGIDAEREIIGEEIRDKQSTAVERVEYRLPNLLWGGHPYGHHTLGSQESLSLLTSAALRNAHKIGYDRSRAVLFISGNLTAQEVQDHLLGVVDVTPANNLSERRQPASYTSFPTWERGETTVETEFATSVVLTLFPVPEKRTVRETLLWKFLGELAACGGSASPLYRIIREEGKLAYRTSSVARYHSDGGWWGFQTQTEKGKIPDVLKGINHLLTDEKFRSHDRFQEVKNALKCGARMRPIDPGKFNDIAINSLRHTGQVLSDEAIAGITDSFTLQEVREALDQLTWDRARIIVFKGMGQS